MSARPSPPPGYETFGSDGATVVAQRAVASAVREVMRGTTLHGWASRQPGAIPFRGRATAWATALPNGIETVVRHSRHGGMLARITGDRFLPPTRAPRELAAALRLAEGGVATPEVLAYAIYPAGGLFVRADVATRRLHGTLLPAAWRDAGSDADRQAIVDALCTLLTRLRAIGAHHPDLNVKNVMILPAPEGYAAAVLDLDRVVFGPRDHAPLADRNVRRLLRSMAKERVGYGAEMTGAQVQALRRTAGRTP